jgi:tRNA (guanine-N7-)-methyltransferase
MKIAGNPTYPYARAPRLPEGDAPIDPRDLVGGSAPVELEIGPGRGTFIMERLESDPQVHMLGLEIRRKWATLVDDKLQARFQGRGRVFAEDAKLILPRLVAGSVSRIYVHFPDPWWKKRHEKRLIAEDALVTEAHRLLCDGGDVFVQTDVEERAERYEQLFAASSSFSPWGESARVADPHFGARSPREKRAIADGLPIYRLRFRRNAV